jgi:glutathione synthase/RimK-type ligase-like ATP-grasp enzyme
MIKNKVILVGKNGRPSMKKVFSLMENKDTDLIIRRKLKHKEYLKVFSNNAVENHTPYHIDTLTLDDKICIRWGNTIVLDHNKNTIVYNQSSAITMATNKNVARMVFTQNDVRTPELYYYIHFGDSLVRFPIVARPVNHCQGKNFVVLHNHAEFISHYTQNNPMPYIDEDFGPNWYYSEYIDKDREFRVHCAHGKILEIMEKPRGEGYAWNRAINGEPFKRVKQEDYHWDVCFQALDAMKALGLDFGGVDVILKGDNAYVLEINTAPTLNHSEKVSKKYAQYFDWLLSSDTRRPHWDYCEFTKAKSLAWKQNQLTNNKIN